MFLYICYNRGYDKDEGAGMWGGCSGCELNWEGGRMGVEVREDTKCFAVTFSLFQGVL